MRARLCEGRGRTFKSCQVHHDFLRSGRVGRQESLKLFYVGSNPTSVAKFANPLFSWNENGRNTKVRVCEKITHAKAQSRKALPRFKGFLCVFAPLRETTFLAFRPAKQF